MILFKAAGQPPGRGLIHESSKMSFFQKKIKGKSTFWSGRPTIRKRLSHTEASKWARFKRNLKKIHFSRRPISHAKKCPHKSSSITIFSILKNKIQRPQYRINTRMAPICENAVPNNFIKIWNSACYTDSADPKKCPTAILGNFWARPEYLMLHNRCKPCRLHPMWTALEQEGTTEADTVSEMFKRSGGFII